MPSMSAEESIPSLHGGSTVRVPGRDSTTGRQSWLQDGPISSGLFPHRRRVKDAQRVADETWRYAKEHYSPSFQVVKKALRNVSQSAADHVSAVLPRRGPMPFAHVN